MPKFSRRGFLETAGVGGTSLAVSGAAQRGGGVWSAPDQARTVRLTRPTLPVLRTAEVVVAGGSFAGVAAALTFAKSRRKVLLVEPQTYLGREATATLRPWLAKRGQLPALVQACTGAKNPEQFPNHSGAVNKIVEPAQADPNEIPLKMDRVKLMLEEQLLEVGVELLYASFPAGLCIEGGRLAGLIVANKSGRQVLPCSMILDATETSVVARIAGAVFEAAGGGPERFNRSIEFEGAGGIQEKTLAVPAQLGIAGDKVMIHHGYRGEGHVLVEFGLMLPVSEFDPAAAMKREIEARKRTIALVSHLVNQAPAFQKAFLAATSYELHGPYTPRMAAPAPAWAQGLPAVETPGGAVPLGSFAGPAKGIWCLEAARLEASQTALLREPIGAARMGEAFADAAAKRWDGVASSGGAPAAAPEAAPAGGGLEVKELESPQRSRRY